MMHLEKCNYIRYTIVGILIISLATILSTCSYEPSYNKTQYEKGQNKLRKHLPLLYLRFGYYLY